MEADFQTMYVTLGDHEERPLGWMWFHNADDMINIINTHPHCQTEVKKLQGIKIMIGQIFNGEYSAHVSLTSCQNDRPQICILKICKPEYAMYI